MNGGHPSTTAPDRGKGGRSTGCACAYEGRAFSFIHLRHEHSPSSSSFSSRLASRLSRRSCRSISWLMRFCSLASSDKQHSILPSSPSFRYPSQSTTRGAWSSSKPWSWPSSPAPLLLVAQVYCSRVACSSSYEIHIIMRYPRPQSWRVPGSRVVQLAVTWGRSALWAASKNTKPRTSVSYRVRPSLSASTVPKYQSSSHRWTHRVRPSVVKRRCLQTDDARRIE